MTKNFNKKKAMSLIKIAFLVIVTIFLVRYFQKNLSDIRELDIHIEWKIFSLSMLFYFIYKITLASLWHYITKLNHAGISYSKAIVSYLYSILGKYIPGKVFMLAARIPAYNEAGVKASTVTICFLLENLCTLLGAAFLFLGSLFFFPNELLNDYKMATILLVVLFFICIHPKIINFFLGIVERLTKKTGLVIPITYPEMIKVVLLFIGNWLIVGIGFYILTCSIYPVPMSEMLYTAGIFGVSAIIGILSIFAPSGIGVREGIIVLGLTLIMPSEYAVIISIVSRLWATVAELILIAIAFVCTKIQSILK